MASFLMLSYLIKAKFRRKWILDFIFFSIYLSSIIPQMYCHSISPSLVSTCGDVLCFHGSCLDGRCVCETGWQGSACHRCQGRIRSLINYFIYCSNNNSFLLSINFEFIFIYFIKKSKFDLNIKLRDINKND